MARCEREIATGVVQTDDLMRRIPAAGWRWWAAPRVAVLRRPCNTQSSASPALSMLVHSTKREPHEALRSPPLSHGSSPVSCESKVAILKRRPRIVSLS